MVTAVRFVSAILLIVSSMLFCFALVLNVASVLHYAPLHSIPNAVVFVPMFALMFVVVILTLRIQRDTPQRKSWSCLRAARAANWNWECLPAIMTWQWT